MRCSSLQVRNRESQNRNAFKDKAAEFIDSDLLRNADIKNWDTLFKTIMDTHFDTKPVIVLDEFQYLGKANPPSPLYFSVYGKKYSKISP